MIRATGTVGSCVVRAEGLEPPTFALSGGSQVQPEHDLAAAVVFLGDTVPDEPEPFVERDRAAVALAGAGQYPRRASGPEVSGDELERSRAIPAPLEAFGDQELP